MVGRVARFVRFAAVTVSSVTPGIGLVTIKELRLTMR